MLQHYFVYNGKQYEHGTVIIISSFDVYSRRVCNMKAKFLYYNAESNEYAIEIYGKEYKYNAERFNKDFVRVYEPDIKDMNLHNQQKQVHKFSDELNIDSLLIAWVWYIFIMIVGVIFYDRIIIWILTSVLFFSYRNKKLKEAGYK